ncbi:hypothetical protein BFG57_17185 [Bacillus solimangrovi]|uniref:HXXEE domain-containing protein n=2 Tax=Bacillus solimangrovi TaxID=1305675 RepID=A0A1E5LD71_9BACI|nr:hypothetical protein BFG57_17185 [Bacillus solimangrovi]
MSAMKRYILILPFVFFIHDIEEIVFVESFLEAQSLLPISITTMEFTFAFLLLFIFFVWGCMTAYRGKHVIGLQPDRFLLFATSLLGMNAFGHIGQVFIFQMYVPGVVTGLFIVLPVCFLIAIHLLKQEIVTRCTVVKYSLIAFFVQIPLAGCSILVSKWLFQVV